MSGDGYKPSRKEEPSFYKNAPYSSRFPQQNQTNRCWAAFVQHKIAVKKFSEESREALKQKALYTTMCPHSWVRLSPSSEHFFHFLHLRVPAMAHLWRVLSQVRALWKYLLLFFLCFFLSKRRFSPIHEPSATSIGPFLRLWFLLFTFYRLRTGTPRSRRVFSREAICGKTWRIIRACIFQC